MCNIRRIKSKNIKNGFLAATTPGPQIAHIAPNRHRYLKVERHRCRLYIYTKRNWAMKKEWSLEYGPYTRFDGWELTSWSQQYRYRTTAMTNNHDREPTQRNRDDQKQNYASFVVYLCMPNANEAWARNSDNQDLPTHHMVAESRPQ